METRKTHYWHKKSQFGKRRKISATVKAVKNEYPERFTRFTTLFSQAVVGSRSVSVVPRSKEN